MNNKGVVAAGHPETTKAAEEVLRDGGNAFDAVIAAHFTACVAEPVLCSLGGGGFMVASKEGGKPVAYDFFTQTPLSKRPTDEIDFYPIQADFGTAQQEFHIGLGSISTPGSVAGLFRIHKDLGSLPISRLIEPAINLAKQGLLLNDFQAYIFSIVAPIYLSTDSARKVFADPQDTAKLVSSGQHLIQEDHADFMDALAHEGEELFYRGEISANIDKLSHEGGGHITREDLESYKVVKRKPLQLGYRDAKVFINPPPSAGGLLIAFALDLLKQIDMRDYRFGSYDHLRLLGDVMSLTNEARIQQQISGKQEDTQKLLNPEFLQLYRDEITNRSKAYRGTTHISVIDSRGNVASMTLSNGEGCGTIVPGTGVMLNNMLGEEDLNPDGFHQWQTNQRMSSMMSPAIMMFDDGREIAIGSGGSNRIRSAILQVISNLIDHQMDVAAAVEAPRIHLEGSHLSVEGGFNQSEIERLIKHYPDNNVWNDLNLFFGGAHTVAAHKNDFYGCGDPRRGGAVNTVK